MIPKFRAWHNELGRMMLVKTMFFFANELEELELNDSIMNDNIPVYPDEIDLMQSTGLVDKNGKEIFEGDVIAIEVDDTETPINARISQNSKIGVLMFHVFEDNEDVPMVESLEDNSVAFEIIGNIYENPEYNQNFVRFTIKGEK